MSRWKHSSEDSHCVCTTNQGLFIPNRQLSATIAFILMLFFVFFMAGYFWGKKYRAEEFLDGITNPMVSEVPTNTVIPHRVPEAFQDNTKEEMPCDTNLHIRNPLDKVEDSLYYAELIGYGTEKAAHKFSEKIAHKGIETVVKKHTNRTAKGRMVNWYQVVTIPYKRHELESLVKKLEKEEKLNDVRLKAC